MDFQVIEEKFRGIKKQQLALGAIVVAVVVTIVYHVLVGHA